MTKVHTKPENVQNTPETLNLAKIPLKKKKTKKTPKLKK